jgi:DNA-binding transcriptional ArsR family regulator
MKQRDIVAYLSALAQESRLDIYRLLVQAGAQGMPAGQIGEQMGLPSPTLSFHLAQLKHAGLVTHRRDGRSIIYAANYPAMNGLIAYLTENCCQGLADCGPEICAPASERKPAKGVHRHEALARTRVGR